MPLVNKWFDMFPVRYRKLPAFPWPIISLVSRSLASTIIKMGPLAEEITRSVRIMALITFITSQQGHLNCLKHSDKAIFIPLRLAFKADWIASRSKVMINRFG